MRLFFIRHGEVEAPYIGTFVGSTDMGLSDLGRHQAQAVATYLKDAPIDTIVTSPLRRARDTAAPLVEALDADVETLAPMAEMSFGQWEGLPWVDIEARDPAFAAKWKADPAAHACPDGENVVEFEARVHAALDGLLEEHRGRTVALFAHAGVNRAVLSSITRRPYMESFCFAQDYSCINAAAWQDDYAQIALVNLVVGPPSAEIE